MKKRGYSVIEVLIAMAIFLFGIFPIIGFTFTSLRGERIAGSKEEAARLATTVVDYIKSRGYEEVKTITGGGFSKTYELVLNDDSSAFITKDHKFEDDFYGNKDEIFVLNSRGLRIEDGRVEFDVYMKLADVELMKINNTSGNDVPSNWVAEDSYENVLTGVKSKPIYGTEGINTQDSQKSDSLSGDRFIIGKVVFRYSERTGETLNKSVDTQFIISPIEEWR